MLKTWEYLLLIDFQKNQINYSKGKLIPSNRVMSFMRGNMIDPTITMTNPDTYLPYKRKLIQDVDEFVRRCEQK